MPETSTLIVFALAAAALIAIPGPNFVYIATRSVSQGRRAGLASALGVETGTLVHVGAAAAGLSALIASSAAAFNVVKYAGAAYLAYLGVRTLMGRKDIEPTGAIAQARAGRTFAEGVLVSVLNPKVALFFVAFPPQFIDAQRGASALQALVLGAVFFVLALCMDLVYALAAGAFGAWLRRRPGFARRQRQLAGGLYLTLGAVAALGSGQGRRH
jgi:threonine/homoserine/homoserine lactone efflux protein